MRKDIVSTVIVLIFLIGFAEVAGVIGRPVAAASAPLVVFNGTSCKSYVTSGFGLDLPKVNYCFSKTKMSYADNLDNFTLNIPTLSGVGLTVVTSQNSSTVDYHVTGTVLGHAVVLDIFWVSQKYNDLVIIRGTISGLSGTLPFAFPLVGGTKIGFKTGNTFISNGHLSFDWSQDAATTTYNNATKTVSFNLGASFNIDPLAIDNTVSCLANPGTSCTTASIILGLNDVIMAGCVGIQTADQFTVSSTPSLTWTLRKSISQTGLVLDSWYAISAASQSYTFKCQTSGAAVVLGVKVFGISGADTATIFDPNAAVPCTASGTSISSPVTMSCTLSTTNVNDFIFGFFAMTQFTTFTAGSGFTAIGVQGRVSAEYKIVAATQTNLAVSATDAFTGTTLWNVIGDAVFATQNTVTSTTTTSTTTSTTTTTPTTTTTTTTTGTTQVTNISNTDFPWLLFVPLAAGAVLALGLIERRRTK